ncbi:MAG: hypothetical protein ACK4GC_15710 [Paracoccaceae bacterium]
MGRLIFLGMFTGLTLGLAFVVVRDIAASGPTAVGLVMLVFPAVGLWLFGREWRLLRRRRSLRQVTEDGVGIWIWVETDGSIGRSPCDPRPAWDAADGGDGDGDGDGGDGGD